MVFKCSRILERSVVEQKSAFLNTRTLFCRSASVLGRPRRTEPPRSDIWNCSDKERSCVGTVFLSGGGGRGRPALRQKSVRVLGIGLLFGGWSIDAKVSCPLVTPVVLCTLFKRSALWARNFCPFPPT